MSTETLNLDKKPLTSGGEDSILAGVWRKVLTDLGVDDSAILDRIDRYANKIMKTHPDKVTQVRGNLRIDVNKKGMTWFTFTKCLRVLGVNKLQIKFTLHHLRKVSVHTLDYELKDDFFDVKDKNKEETEPGALSTFFKQIQHDLGIGVREFEQLLEYYIRRERLVVDLRNKTNIRGYLKKDFSALRMSWRNFMKAMVFLCVLKMDLQVTLFFPRDITSVHSYKILLNDMEDYSEELKNDLGI